MSVTVLVATFLIQIIAYAFLRNKGKIHYGWIILTVFIIVNIFIFPNLKIFEQEIYSNHTNCGLHRLPIFFIFWILGNIGSILIYITHRIISRKITVNHD
ncbi:hypothetical protein C8N46_10272 [Kordia periserrulae]|uniref:Uncharacterized protein n=1 Tax=Kordia periserrulae TaxID=701523 RepID=A0A2T6C2X0_9FLAO|nr:hypothetical protein C8N46_10272 [Kordia periserrulae]